MGMPMDALPASICSVYGRWMSALSKLGTLRHTALAHPSEHATE